MSGFRLMLDQYKVLSCFHSFVIYIYMDGMVRAVIDRVLGKGLELLLADGGRCEINELFIADDTAIVADSELKLC